MQIDAYSSQEAKAFAEKWLPAWTGNNPELLASFYTEDSFYSDPVIPRGVQGKKALLEYFRKLLAKNPHWVWTQTSATPLQDGFVNFWKAEIPAGDTKVICHGICLVQLRQGLIYRNQVFFDPSELQKRSTHL